LKGKLGDGDSEVIRNIVISYMTLQGYLGEAEGKPLKAGSVTTEGIAGELDMQDNMITALAELLEERGLIDYHEWENRIKKKLVKKPR